VLFLESIIYESFRKKVALSQNLLTKKVCRITICGKMPAGTARCYQFAKGMIL